MKIIPYFSRAGRGDRSALQDRAPEVRPLAEKTIALFGLGCLGAPSAIELARAGIGEMRVLDHDYVDPATTCRWPLGLTAAGLPKAGIVKAFIETNYPASRVLAWQHRLGGVRDIENAGASDLEVLRQMLDGASLIYDASAEVGVNYFLSVQAQELGLPYIGVSGTYGGWGGKIFRILPEQTEGCWFCYRLACEDKAIPEPPSDPGGEVQPIGCADPTFTGAGFDMLQIALQGVRTAVSTLCSSEEKGYPNMDWDAVHIALRSPAGNLVAPTYTTFPVKKHPSCPQCSAQ